MTTRPDFWRGMSTGLAVLVATLLFLPRGESAAHAEPMQGVDNQGKYALAVAGSEPNRSDMLWVLHEHPTHPDLRSERGDGAAQKPNQITLCLYKMEKQGEQMKLVAARDIAYDIELQNWNQTDPDAEKVFALWVKRLAAAKKK